MKTVDFFAEAHRMADNAGLVEAPDLDVMCEQLNRACGVGKHVGSQHYRNVKLQPTAYCMVNGLDHAMSSIVKYATRFNGGDGDRCGKKDLEKIRHFVTIAERFHYGEE